MGTTKSEIFTNQQNQLATIAKVLGHPARIAIIQHLIKVNTCICGDLVEEIGLAQPTISQHLKELKNVGIIQGSIEGSSRCYCINKTNWEQFQTMFDTFFNTLPTQTNNQCC